MLKVGDELLDSLYHLSLGEVLLGKDAFQLVKEPVHLILLVASGLANNAQSLEPLHIYLLTWNIKLLVCLFTSGVRTKINRRILIVIPSQCSGLALCFIITAARIFYESISRYELIADTAESQHLVFT